MNTEDFKDLIPDYILGKLSKTQDEAFKTYVHNHPDALDEWIGLNDTFKSHDVEPSAKMDTKFYDFLNDEVTKIEAEKAKQLIGYKSYLRFMVPLIAASLMLLFGFFIGKHWQSQEIVPIDGVSERNTITNETDLVRTDLVISLANESSASKRLKALSEANKLENATEQVIMALFKMLNTDTNTNVRLAAVASLSKYVNKPEVRTGLLQSIIKQESPLVQIALADLMVTLKEQKSINSMETLLLQPDINATVKLKLEESIKQII